MNPKPNEIYQVGTIVKHRAEPQVARRPIIKVLVEGIERGKSSPDQRGSEGYMQVSVRVAPLRGRRPNPQIETGMQRGHGACSSST